MNDPEEIRNQLDRLATPDPYGGVDGGQLLARGRRGRRRRRILAGSGAAAGVVAAVTVTATLLSGAGAPAPGNETSVAGTTTSPRPTSPGGSGTATSVGPHEVITEAEAVRRCGEQWSRDAGRPIRPVHVLPTGPSESEPQRKVRTGTLLGIYHDNILGFYKCMIPRRGENRPGEHATPRVPDPTLHAPADADDTTLLRACSAGLDFLATAPDSELSYPRPSKPIATDLTGWRIVARSSLPKVGTTFVALSPTADKVAYCDIDVPGAKAESALGSEVRLTSPDGKRTPYSKPHLSEHILETGSQCNAQCTGWLHRESGRLPSKVVRLHVASPHGKSVDVPVKDGYWALVWANGDPQRRLAVNVTAYDAEGKVVRPDPI